MKITNKILIRYSNDFETAYNDIYEGCLNWLYILDK